MNYENPELLDALAAAYVLGTLRGGARRRFAGLASESAVIQHAIWRWERRLLPLADSVSPVEPPSHAWEEIERRLGFKTPKQPRTWWWPAVTAVALLVTTVTLLTSVLREPSISADSAAERLAFIQDSDQQPVWVITVDEQSGRLESVAINAPAQDADRVFQLWMLPAEGAPESFGLLPATNSARAEFALSPALLALLRDAKGVAVSVEPPGGSPTGAPTGPVVFTAPVIEI